MGFNKETWIHMKCYAWSMGYGYKYIIIEYNVARY